MAAGEIVAWILFGLVAFLVILGFTGVIPPKSLEGGTCEFSQGVCTVFTALGTPDWFLSSRNFYWYFLAPIGVICVVVYGFLDTLRLFRNNTVNLLLAIFIAFISIPTNVFTTFVATLMTVLGTYAVSAFFIVFVMGVFFISYGVITETRYENVWKPRIKVIDEKIKILEDNLKKMEGDPAATTAADRIREKIRDYRFQEMELKADEKASKRGEKKSGSEFHP